MSKKLIAAVIGTGFVLSAAPAAFAGEWRLNPRACPDLVEDRFDRREDRRDARVDYGRRDRREDIRDRRENRRDEAVTICPLSAFYYEPDRYERERAAKSRGRGHAYGRRTPRPPLKWDRRMGMQYLYDNGHRIYIAGSQRDRRR